MKSTSEKLLSPIREIKLKTIKGKIIDENAS